MGMGKIVGKEVNEWVGTAVIVVISTLVMLGFRSIQSVGTCTAGNVYNTTDFLCHNGTAAGNVTTTPTGVFTTINDFVTAFAEPANWIGIVIIAIIGFGILSFYNKRIRSKN